MRFTEVARIDEVTPMQLWGGRDGLLDAFYLATSGRSGGTSRIFRSQNGLHWTDDNAPEGAETLHKIRNSADTLYAFFETSGESPIISRALSGGDWGFEAIGAPLDFTGGRGLEVDPSTGQIWAGGSGHWNISSGGERFGKLYYGGAGGYAAQRELTPGMNWETLLDEDGILWEFWHQTTAGETTTPPSCWRDGDEVPAVTEFVGCADSFLGAMYAGGNDEADTGVPRLWRWNGTGWDEVLTLDTATDFDHVLRVPRGAGELWVVGKMPLQVYRSVDGDSWEDMHLPLLMQAEGDANTQTAIGYFKQAVWIASADVDLGKIRLYCDRRADVLLEVI